MKKIREVLKRNVFSITFTCSILLLFFMILAGACFAVEQDPRDENGVTVYDYLTAEETGRRIAFYTAFNPTGTSSVYNEAGESATISGSVDVKGLSDIEMVQISLPTLGSTSLQVDVEGRNSKSATWGLIFSKIFTSATTTDLMINVLEPIDAVRVGTKIVTNGTDVLSVFGQFARKIQGGN